jgi:hypothetical protein
MSGGTFQRPVARKYAQRFMGYTEKSIYELG